jgi:hypothetical protein
MAVGEHAKTPGVELYARGSCTDKTWKSADCPNFCVDANFDNLHDGVDMIKCDNDSWFYCKRDKGPQGNCTNGLNVLVFSG